MVTPAKTLLSLCQQSLTSRGSSLGEGLSVVGLLAFLVRAKAWGIVREARPLLDALKRQGFFISDELYQHVLRMAGEL